MDSFTLNKVEFDAVRHILAGYCSCSLGKTVAMHITPSRTPATIELWLNQVSQMVAAVRDVSPPPFGGVTDITAHLERARPGGGADGNDFATIASTLEGAHNVRAYLEQLDERLDLLRELAGGIGNFEGEVRAIHSTVDSDGRVRDEASQRLADIRQQIAQTTQHIHDVIYGYLRDPEVSRLLQNPTVTLHGDRYVLPVKAENRGRLSGVVHRASNTGATVFVEPNASVELNNRLADLCEDERREVQRLLSQLALRVSARDEEIAAALRHLAQVDLLSAKAQYAYQFDMTCPEMAERGPLQLTQARHPLLVDQAYRQEKSGVAPDRRHPVVPIDVRLGSDFDLLVITGSNTGGKTVTLKTVAMLALMAQSGMHIPAQRGSKLPIFRDIFIDVGDEQSLQQSLSTFGAHIKRIRYILGKIDRNCLVLMDELGSGTDPDEGAAIGQAILDELRGVGCLGMATTHLSALKAYAYNHERVDNASVEFDVETLSPTYRLQIGTPGESHAIAVAQRLGMPKRITSTARKHMGEQHRQFRRAIQATSVARQSAEQARSEALETQLEAQTQLEAYQSKLADLHRLREEFETWLASLNELKKGDEVMVPSLKKTGHLVRLELHRQIAVVDADSVQVEVPLRDLMPDLGQHDVREQISAMRRQILDQAGQTQAAMAEARRLQEEYQRSLHQQQERGRQFDNWLSAIARLKVGDEVSIAKKPGRARVLMLDLGGLRATVESELGQEVISLQDLFPQTGPFAYLPPPSARPERPPRRGREQRGQGEQRGQRRDDRGGDRRQGPPQRGQQGDQRQRPPREPREPQPDRPMERRSPETHSAQASREAVLALKPGQQVYVVPFHKRATLIRINAEKELAVVQSGIFEMELPLADLEPVKDLRPDKGERREKGPGRDKAPGRDKSAPRTRDERGGPGEAGEQKPEAAPEPPPAPPPEPAPPAEAPCDQSAAEQGEASEPAPPDDAKEQP